MYATDTSSRIGATDSAADNNNHRAPRGKPFVREIDWRMLAIVGGSIAAGAVLGAGIALLTAPQSGAHTRLALESEWRRRRPWHRSPWDRLGDELAQAAQRRNRRLRRKAAARAAVSPAE